MALVRQKDAVEWVGFNDGSERLMSQAKKIEPSVPIFWDRYKSDLSKLCGRRSAVDIGAGI